MNGRSGVYFRDNLCSHRYRCLSFNRDTTVPRTRTACIGPRVLARLISNTLPSRLKDVVVSSSSLALRLGSVQVYS